MARLLLFPRFATDGTGQKLTLSYTGEGHREIGGVDGEIRLDMDPVELRANADTLLAALPHNTPVALTGSDAWDGFVEEGRRQFDRMLRPGEHAGLGAFLSGDERVDVVVRHNLADAFYPWHLLVDEIFPEPIGSRHAFTYLPVSVERDQDYVGSRVGVRRVTVAMDDTDAMLERATVESARVRRFCGVLGTACRVHAFSEARLRGLGLRGMLARSMTSPTDLLHWVGHHDVDERHFRFVASHDEQALAQDLLRDTRGTDRARLFFLNTCNSIRDTWGCTLSSAGHFYRAGAIAVLGTLLDVDDDDAERYARHIYARLLRDARIAEAHQAVCRHLLYKHASAAGFAYAVYGMPDAQVFPVVDRCGTRRATITGRRRAELVE